MINYKCNRKPKTSNYSHGGHVHNLVEKAYQEHSFGGDIYDSSSAVLKKIKNHLPSVSSEVIGNQMKKIPEYIHSGAHHIVEEAPKLINHGTKLAQELIKRHLGHN
jgi:hypothetical protein